MVKFSELSLTDEQEAFVDKQMYQWGAWVRSGRLDKRQVNMIAKLMQSVIPTQSNDPMCEDDVGLMISHIIDQFFMKNDRTLRFIVFAYYVNKFTVNKIAVQLRKQQGEKIMQPCSGKSNIRVPSIKTVARDVKRDLNIAKAIIHELLLTGFILLRTGGKNAKNIKIGY